jgi:serine/threonine protein kinase
MEDYEMLTRLGGGSFADVYKAREKSTGDIVAIKVLKKKYKKLEECNDLRECKSLQILNKISIYEKGFENIINLKKIIFTKKTGVLNLIFEYMEKDLLELMKSLEPKHLPEERIKDIVYQTLQGLAFMHKSSLE